MHPTFWGVVSAIWLQPFMEAYPSIRAYSKDRITKKELAKKLRLYFIKWLFFAYIAYLIFFYGR